jgi:hypothetical protein
LEGLFRYGGEEEMENLPAKTEQPKKKKTGHRPKIEIDWDLFENLCRIQCTLEEMTGFLKCSEDTIERAVKRQYKKPFADIVKNLKADGRASLRRTQWVAAMKGNTAMQIWLGKQHLDQRDKFPDDTPDERELTLRIVYGEKSGGNGEDKEIDLKAFGDRNPLARSSPDPETDHRDQGEA